MHTAEQYLDEINTLAPAPQVLPKLLAVLANPDYDTAQIAELVTFDPALTARLLQACNSAYLALAKPVKDVPEAVSRLGTNAIYRLVAAVNGARTLRPSRGGWGVDPSALWQHSVTTALAAQFLARDAGQDQGMAFTAGMLHDLGKVVLAESFKERYAQLLAEPGASLARSWGREKQSFGVDHSEMGGRLLARWKFPAAIVVSVWHHHAPAGAKSFERLTACLTLANAVAYEVDEPGALAGITADVSLALDLLQISPPRLQGYLEETRENFAFVQALCGVAA